MSQPEEVYVHLVLSVLHHLSNALMLKGCASHSLLSISFYFPKTYLLEGSWLPALTFGKSWPIEQLQLHLQKIHAKAQFLLSKVLTLCHVTSSTERFALEPATQLHTGLAAPGERRRILRVLGKYLKVLLLVSLQLERTSV